MSDSTKPSTSPTLAEKKSPDVQPGLVRDGIMKGSRPRERLSDWCKFLRGSITRMRLPAWPHSGSPSWYWIRMPRPLLMAEYFTFVMRA